MTLDGTLIHKNGNMTGGVSGETRTQPWDDNEVAQLQRQRDTCMSELKELGKRRHELSRDDELQAKIGRIEAELAVQRDEMVSCLTGRRTVQEADPHSLPRLRSTAA